MAYFGPANRARQYFIDLGYEPVARQTTADFLVAVTDPAGRIPRAGVLNAPRSANEFAQAFLQSELGALNRADMVAYEHKYVGKEERVQSYMASVRDEHATTSRKTRFVPFRVLRSSPHATTAPIHSPSRCKSGR